MWRLIYTCFCSVRLWQTLMPNCPSVSSWWLKSPTGLVLSPQTHTNTEWPGGSGYGYDLLPNLLTERVDELSHGDGEGAAGVVNPEEDHGHVLGRAHTSPQRSRVAVIHVALVERQRVILGAGELLSLHHPAVKHLHRLDREIQSAGTAGPDGKLLGANYLSVELEHSLGVNTEMSCRWQENGLCIKLTNGI